MTLQLKIITIPKNLKATLKPINKSLSFSYFKVYPEQNSKIEMKIMIEIIQFSHKSELPLQKKFNIIFCLSHVVYNFDIIDVGIKTKIHAMNKHPISDKPMENPPPPHV